MILTVKDLREAIKDLPDDFPVAGYDGSDQPCVIRCWVTDYKADDIDEPDQLVISTD